jgi:DNA-binding response OmpR family regulator
MAEVGSVPARAGARVLLVDDEDAVLSAIARILRSAGCTVTKCESATAASELVVEGAFDVVVSDIDMPGLSGLDLLKLLRDREVGVPLILMTGAPTLDSAMRAVELGAFKYLVKPLDSEELRQTIAQAAGTRARPGSASRPRGEGSASSAPSPSSATPAAAVVGVTRSAIASGTVLADRYEFRRLLGEGGMSQVWEAVQLRTGRAVAVKLLRTSLNAQPEMRKRLLREARAASRVDHPNVVEIFDAFELADETPVLVMPLLRGRTLSEHLAQTGKLPLRQAASLFLPVVSAVGAAHARGVVHRDLKPDNIFVCDEGNGRTKITVLDFGIAKLASGEESEGAALTATGAMVGTPGYMSPEQAAGERGVDQRADVWAIAAILYEILAGVRPVHGDNIGQMLKQLYTDGIRPLASLVPELPPELTDLVDRMLSREKSDRPGDLQPLFVLLGHHASSPARSFPPPAMLRDEPPSDVVSAVQLAHAPTESASPPSPAARRSR